MQGCGPQLALVPSLQALDRRQARLATSLSARQIRKSQMAARLRVWAVGTAGNCGLCTDGCRPLIRPCLRMTPRTASGCVDGPAGNTDWVGKQPEITKRISGRPVRMAWNRLRSLGQALRRGSAWRRGRRRAKPCRGLTRVGCRLSPQTPRPPAAADPGERGWRLPGLPAAPTREPRERAVQVARRRMRLR